MHSQLESKLIIDGNKLPDLDMHVAAIYGLEPCCQHNRITLCNGNYEYDPIEFQNKDCIQSTSIPSSPAVCASWGIPSGLTLSSVITVGLVFSTSEAANVDTGWLHVWFVSYSWEANDGPKLLAVVSSKSKSPITILVSSEFHMSSKELRSPKPVFVG